MSNLYKTKKSTRHSLKFVLIFLITIFLSGCATTSSLDTRDPLEGFNRSVYSFNKLSLYIINNYFSVFDNLHILLRSSLNVEN